MSRLLVDASPLIALARIARLDLLRAFGMRVATAEDVMKEAARIPYPEHGPLTEARAAGWLEVLEVKGDASALAVYGLGRGEASLLLAAGPGDVLVLDDRAARRFAKARGHACTGVLGLLVAAAQEGLIARARAIEVLDGLAQSSFRMSADLYQRTLREIQDTGSREDR